MENIKIVRVNNNETLKSHLLEIDATEGIRVLILIFADEKSFASANDFDKDLLEQIKNFRLPIITIIKDEARGFVFELILASHICITSKEASFLIDNKEKIALQIGSKNAEKLKRVENEIDAIMAMNLGIINEIVDAKDLEAEAIAMAETITKLAPMAITSCLKAVNKGLELELIKGLRLETELFTQIFATEDMKEGTSAFLEKRKPIFKGE